VDYDDDEDDEDYNLPSRMPESGTESEKAADSLSKSKRKSPDSRREESELNKKQRLEQQSNDGKVAVAAACSTCSEGDLPCEDSAAGPPVEATDGTSNDSSVEEGTADGESCSKCLPNTVDRQPSGEDCQLAPINGASVAGSESYPVR